MTKEKLDALLSSGAITQEEYDEMLKSIGGVGDGLQEEKKDGEEKVKSEFDEDALERLVQAKVDKITSKLGKEKADLQKKLDAVKKEKLSDAERAELERKEKEDELAEREKALTEKENRLYAIKAIKAAGLDDGSDKSLELVDFVMSEDEEAIDSKIKAFAGLVKKFVQAEIDKTFRDNGRTPAKGSGTDATQNPYAKDTFNLTEQMRLEVENPELAKTLKAAAGK